LTAGLIPGMYISGHLHTDEKLTRTLPNNAFVSEGTKSFIFIEDDNALEEQHQKEGLKAFKMVEVITGQKDDRYTEVHLLDSLPENTQIVMNAAYYLLADMNKEETNHED
jgi:cobalt-zinc-cadmium efflux system membrane fusion protein